MYQYAEVARSAGRDKPGGQSGFTLIELVAVILILGVLFATALPKFVDLGKDARVAAVASAKGAVIAAANMAFMKCSLVTGCVTSREGAAIAGPDGTMNHMFNGYPTGMTRTGSHFGIKDWVSISGFTITELNPSTTDFTKDGAPDPSNCKVSYTETNSSTVPPLVVATTTGC